MRKPTVLIITPALAGDNNGNWQTASRWARMLAPAYRVRLAREWPSAQAGAERRAGAPESNQEPIDLMIALHARRSAASIQAWKQGAAPDRQRPLLLALTGTDLYRDIENDAQAQRSLELADALIVLNELGPLRLPPALRPACHVVLQSCPSRKPLQKTKSHFRALMVGHLRDEKDPATYWRAAERLRDERRILLDHAGSALDAQLGQQATALMQRLPQFRWLGGLSHEAVRARIQRAHVLVHASRMEGGAHVVIEALRSGTPVVASRIDGNLGLLGADYPAVFEPGDDEALARWLEQLWHDPDMLDALRQRCMARAALFAPERESESLHRVVRQLMASSQSDPLDENRR